MIIIPKTSLPFLLAGREIKVVLDVDGRTWRRGRNYAVGVRHNHTICRAEVIKIDRHTDEDDWDKLALTIRHDEQDHTVRLLGKKGGYVTDPSQALPDEPEAIDELTQRRYADEGRERDRERMADRRRRQRGTIAEQLAEMRADLAEQPDRHVARAIRAIEHQLSSIERVDEAA